MASEVETRRGMKTRLGEKAGSRKDEGETGAANPPDSMAPRRRKPSEGTMSPRRRRTVSRFDIDH